jgi:hypothetical protein
VCRKNQKVFPSTKDEPEIGLARVEDSEKKHSGLPFSWAVSSLAQRK